MGRHEDSTFLFCGIFGNSNVTHLSGAHYLPWSTTGVDQPSVGDPEKVRSNVSSIFSAGHEHGRLSRPCNCRLRLFRGSFSCEEFFSIIHADIIWHHGIAKTQLVDQFHAVPAVATWTRLQRPASMLSGNPLVDETGVIGCTFSGLGGKTRTTSVWKCPWQPWLINQWSSNLWRVSFIMKHHSLNHSIVG